jgi:hypothetical protein
MFCGILDCFGFRFLTFNRKGRSVLKKGRDGRNQLSLGHGKLLSCPGLSQSPIQNPIQKKNLFGSVSVRPVSHTVICLLSCRNVRSPSLGLKSEAISRLFTVRGRVPRLSIKSLSYESLPPLHLCNLITVLVGCLEILVQILEVGKLESWKHYAITIFFFSVSDFVLKGGGV